MLRDERAGAEFAPTWAHDEGDGHREECVATRHAARAEHNDERVGTLGDHAIDRHRGERVATRDGRAGDKHRDERVATFGGHRGDKHRDERVATFGGHAGDQHRQIDRELRSIARQRAGFDAQEARWLREADKHQIWRKLGFSTALEYLEDVFGYAPRTAMERLRVAKELADLPQLEAELASGALPYSAAKELSRVMTPETQAQWLTHARGQNLRDIEEMVAGRHKGDSPDDPRDPDSIFHEVRLKLTARTKALWEQMRAALETECDGHLEDDQVAEMVSRRVLGGEGSPSDKPSRPVHRIVVHKCDDCGRAWQEGRGRWLQLREGDLALAECDAVSSGEHDHAEPSAKAAETIEAAGAPDPRKSGRTTSDIPERTRKRVWARDKGRCRVPGCRATRHIDIHHLIPRALGGTHDEWSLTLLCSGHHKLHHEGILSITGRAPDELVFIRDGKRLVDARARVEACAVDTLHSTAAPTPTVRNRFADVAKLEHAKQALRQLGFKARAARAALEQASAHVGGEADVSQLVRAALELSRPDVPKTTASANRAAPGEGETTKMATQALVQLGYPRPVATSAVAAASVHVGGGNLATLIKEALQRTS